MPTLPVGGNGLGRHCFDIADGLAKKGHTVTLYAGKGSIAPDNVKLIIHDDETRRAHTLAIGIAEQAVIDVSHNHDLSRLNPDLPIVNWVADVECSWKPPNGIVGNEWQLEQYPTARIIRAGVDVDNIPFQAIPETPPHLAFCAKIHHAKGYDLALETARLAGIPCHFAGQKFLSVDLPDYVGEITDNARLYEFLGNAVGLLAPSRLDAGGRVVLESAACGTPVITLDCTGTQYHVKHCVSGFICYDVAEMVEAVQDLSAIERAWCRNWVAETHSMSGMISALETMCEAVASGERW